MKSFITSGPGCILHLVKQMDPSFFVGITVITFHFSVREARWPSGRASGSGGGSVPT